MGDPELEEGRHTNSAERSSRRLRLRHIWIWKLLGFMILPRATYVRTRAREHSRGSLKWSELGALMPINRQNSSKDLR